MLLGWWFWMMEPDRPDLLSGGFQLGAGEHRLHLFANPVSGGSRIHGHVGPAQALAFSHRPQHLHAVRQAARQAAGAHRPVGRPRNATLATDTPTSSPIRCQRLYSVK